MAITSEDIQNQSFSIDRKGYDVDEVDVFLERVADEIDLLNNRIAELESAAEASARSDAFDTVAMTASPFSGESFAEQPQAGNSASDDEKDARIAELERMLGEKKANDAAIAQALIIAQRTADQTRSQAEDDADQIIADAQDEAARIIADANADKQDIIEETRRLDEDCEAIRGRFQDILKDFINDATTKLADISDASIMASAHARIAKAPARQSSDAASVANAAMASNYVTPVFTASDNTVAVPVTPMSHPMDRDLSGFGDAAVNDLEFDDLD